MPIAVGDPIKLAVATLRKALRDNTTAVRNQAALSLGLIGAPAADAAAAIRN